jgi:hypothetical protein
MRAMPNTTSLVMTKARRAPAQKGFSLTISLIVAAVDLDISHITQVGELAEVSCEARVGGQSAYVPQKFAIRQYVPSTG